MAFLVIGTAASLISGSAFFALIKESFLAATFGLICLGSLLAEQPRATQMSRLVQSHARFRHAGP
jgi:hypothetical protein